MPTTIDSLAKRTLSEKHSRAEAIRSLLTQYDETLVFPYEQLQEFSEADLLAYLRASHRYYLEQKLPEIEQTIYSLFRDYTDSDELLLAMCRFFVGYQRKLVAHIQAEERELFPYIEALLKASENDCGENACLSHYSAAHFLEKHTDVEEDLRSVSEIIESCLHERNMPLPFRVFVAQLQHFEIDLCKHAIVEDEILLPRILQLEEKMRHRTLKAIAG